jgi:WD40 repeat protein
MSIQHTAPISGLSASGTYIATAGYDNRIVLWNAKSHEAVSRGWHDHLVNQCEFSPDGELLVSASSDYSARVWSVPDLRLLKVLEGHTDDVVKCSFSPDGQRIATCSYDSTLRVYTRRGDLICVCCGHSGLIETFDWEKDGKLITSCGTDGSIRTWSSETGGLVTIRDGFNYDLDALVTTADGHTFIGTDEGTILGSGKEGRTVTPAHSSGVKRLVSRGTLLLSLGYDQRAILWRTSGTDLEKIVSTVFPSHIWARSAAFMSEFEIAFGTFGSTYSVWNWQNDVWHNDGYSPSVSLNCVIVLPGGERLAIGDAGVLLRDGVVSGGTGTLCNCIAKLGETIVAAGQLGVIYNATTGEEVYRCGSPINCVCSLRSTHERVVFGTYDGSLVFCEATEDEIRIANVIKLPCNAIKGVCSMESRLFCGSADGTLTLLDTDSLAVVCSVRQAHDGILNGVASYADGFATISRDLTLRLWNLRGDRQLTVKSRHTNSIKCIASDPSGMFLATGSYRGTVDVYSVAVKKWIGSVQRPTASGVSSLAWDARRGLFVAASYDGQLYDVPIEQ